MVALFGGNVIDLLTTNDGIRAVARQYLPWGIFMPLVSVWSFQLDGIFIGATWSREMRNAMVLSLLSYLAVLPIFVPLYGNHGLWGSFMILMVARGVTLGWMLPGLQRRIVPLG